MLFQLKWYVKLEKQKTAIRLISRILGMDKVELLEEMMVFQEERASVGELTVTMMVRGQILFKALEDAAETEELRSLTRSYRRHLRFELEAFMKSQPQVREKAK